MHKENAFDLFLQFTFEAVKYEKDFSKDFNQIFMILIL